MTRLEEIREKVIAAIEDKANKDFIIEDKDFTVCYYKGVKDIHAWVNNGGRALFGLDRINSPYEYVDIIVERINEYCDGYIHCCDCGKKFPVSEIESYRRSYFAGVYCQECWDREWKAREAKETYD